MSPFYKLLFSFFSAFVCLLFYSCQETDVTGNQSSNHSTSDIPLNENQSGIDDLEALLNSGTASRPITVSGASIQNKDDNEIIEPVVSTSTNAPILALDTVNQDPKLLGVEGMEAEQALQTLEESAIEHQRSIEELRKINSNKDKTIASLSTINDELLAEIRRLKDLSQSDSSKVTRITSDSTNNVLDLRSEIKSLKNSLILKSNEIKDLRVRNDSLEVRISSLEQTPTSKIVLAEPTIKNTEPKTNFFPKQNQGACTLTFDAVVTSYSGKTKEAFYTEFFVLNKSLSDILSEGEGKISLDKYPGIQSYSELWAKCRKNSFLFPKLHDKIRDLLLNQVNLGNGDRIRTDINGAAKIDDLEAGRYFIIGTAPLGKVGVTWNVPINLAGGVSRVSLTLANASWSM